MVFKRQLLLALGLLAFWAPSGAVMASWHEKAPPFSGQIRDFIILQKMRPAPDHTFTGPHGEALTIGAFKGKVVLLNFWATWCPPCVEEMPSLDRLQGRLGGDQFEVLALSLDDTRGIVDKFFAHFGFEHLAVYRGKGEKSMQAFAVGLLPTSLVVGPNGNLLGALAGSAKWDSPEAEALMRYFIAKAKESAE